MKTIQIMTRSLHGVGIQQRTSDGFYLLSSLDRAGALYRLQHDMPRFNVSSFLSNDNTIEFIAELESKAHTPAIEQSGRGRASQTWVHPYLMVKIALAMSPKLEVEVYGWIYDELIKYRIDSCESYKRMCGYLFDVYPNKREFGTFIKEVADKIRLTCGLKGGPEAWNKATSTQLKMRDKLHDTISMASSFTPDAGVAVRMGVSKFLKDYSPALLASPASS